MPKGPRAHSFVYTAVTVPIAHHCGAGPVPRCLGSARQRLPRSSQDLLPWGSFLHYSPVPHRTLSLSLAAAATSIRLLHRALHQHVSHIRLDCSRGLWLAPCPIVYRFNNAEGAEPPHRIIHGTETTQCLTIPGLYIRVFASGSSVED